VHDALSLKVLERKNYLGQVERRMRLNQVRDGIQQMSEFWASNEVEQLDGVARTQHNTLPHSNDKWMGKRNPIVNCEVSFVVCFPYCSSSSCSSRALDYGSDFFGRVKDPCDSLAY